MANKKNDRDGQKSRDIGRLEKGAVDRWDQVWDLGIKQNFSEMHKKKMQEHDLTASVKHGGGTMMVWGCFEGGKMGDL